MSDKSWGHKRICSCGKIRFYDLNKSKIECPECGETIDINFLSNTKIEKNLLKKNVPILENQKEQKNKKSSSNQKADIEKEDILDIEDTSKLPVAEIIGNNDGKKSEPKAEKDNEDQS